MKLKQMIIENFVPFDEVSKTEKKAVWEDESDNWVIPPQVTTSAWGTRSTWCAVY